VEVVADKKTKATFDAKRGVAAHCAARCEENGLIVRAIGENIAFCPPLVITETQVHELFDKFERSLGQTLEWVGKH
jgi:4-aminobutyrate--pyruvate transaminase